MNAEIGVWNADWNWEYRLNPRYFFKKFKALIRIVQVTIKKPPVGAASSREIK